MEPKKYRAKSIQEAIGLVKEEIGPDAMILSTKRLPKSVRDPYGASLFEVTAVSPKHYEKDTSDRDQILSNAFEKFNKSGLISENDPDDKFSGEIPNNFRTELSEIRDMVCLYSLGENFSGLLQAKPEYLNLYANLIKSGMSDVRARMFIEKVDFEFKSPANKKGRAGKDEFARSVLNEISSSIKVVNPFENQNGKIMLAAFIGPTGVGKTTTIAKIAADLHLRQKKKIGLISIDNYRVGALEQLKIYASIMGVPCLRAFSKEDFRLAIKKMRNRDVILIDTAGHSHFDETKMKELMPYMKGDFSVSTHLVLSTTTDRFIMKDAVNRFSVLNPETLIFTKLDETKRRGIIIDQAMDTNLPVSFLTNGQKVPDDIITATPKKILQLVLGLSKKEVPAAVKPKTEARISDKIFSKRADSVTTTLFN